MATRIPTSEIMGELQFAYDFYNRELFTGQLPNVLLTLQRKSLRTYGYFAQARFSDGEGRTDELAMNPMHFHSLNTIDVLSTLVHEMAHAWQVHFGSPGRARYHNREWGEKMKSLGLHPSHTGAPGGRETGDQMDHYVMAAGPFERLTRQLLQSGFRLSWADASCCEVTPADPNDPSALGGVPASPKDKSNRVRYLCGGCGLKAWAKPGAALMCGQCRFDLLPVR